VHCKENPIYVFLFWEFRGLSPNFLVHVSVGDLYIPRIRMEIHKWEPAIYIGFSLALHFTVWSIG
jgi:hypothetical protein